MRSLILKEFVKAAPYLILLLLFSSRRKVKKIDITDHKYKNMPSTFTFKEFKIKLTAAKIKTANNIAIDIPQLAAPGIGYAWSLAMAELRFFAGSAAFTSTTVFLITDTAAVEQMVSGVILNSAADSFSKFISTGSSDTAIVENKKVTIVTNADSTIGDGYCTIYGIARKIKL
jgi:hypothetical protein